MQWIISNYECITIVTTLDDRNMFTVCFRDNINNDGNDDRNAVDADHDYNDNDDNRS